MRTTLNWAFLLVLLPPVAAGAAQPSEHWVGTWAAAPMGYNNIQRQPNGPAATPTAPLVPAPPAAPPAPPTGPLPNQMLGAADTTLREIVHISIGGPAARVVLTNEFGTGSLTIGAVQIAESAGGSSISLTAASGLTFGGRTSVMIPPGALVVSDPVAMNLHPSSDLAISLFLPAQPIPQVSAHGAAHQTSYSAPGNVAGAKTLEAPAEIVNWPFLKGVDVKIGGNSGAIVAFGDSITDGTASTQNANARWPDVLARRLLADKRTADISVLNEGIGGNRVLHDNTGPSALARFDRDVIAQAGVKYVVVLESINDIGHAADPDPAKVYDVVSAEDLIAGLTQLAERAHMHGIKMIGATLTPYAGAKYASPAGESIRTKINAWIRTTDKLDGFVDFDRATQDPAHPTMFLPDYDSGDHLHPKDAGYKAMGEAFDLKMFIK